MYYGSAPASYTAPSRFRDDSYVRFSRALRELLHGLGGAYGPTLPTCEAGSPLGRSSSHAAVVLAKGFIEAHSGEEIDLDFLAREAGVSKFYLVRLFRAHLDVTPMGYAWQRRVTTAVDLLLGTGLPLGAVARRCGFATTQHFSRRIRQHTGLPPSEVRRRRWDGTSPSAHAAPGPAAAD